MKTKNKIFLFLGVFLAVCLIVGGVIWYILAQKQNDDVEAKTPDGASVSLDPTDEGLPENELIALSYDDGWKGFVDADGKPVDILSFVKQADGSYTDDTHIIPADEVEKFVKSVKAPYTDREKAYLALFASPMPEPSSEDDPDTTESSESESLVEDDTEATESDTEESTENSSSMKSSTGKNKPETGTAASTEVKPYTTESTEVKPYTTESTEVKQHTTASTERPASTTSSSKETSTEAPQPKPDNTEKPKEDTTEAKGCDHDWKTESILVNTIEHAATYKTVQVEVEIWMPDTKEMIRCNSCHKLYENAKEFNDDIEHYNTCGCTGWGTYTVTVGGHYETHYDWEDVLDHEAWTEYIYKEETRCTKCGAIK